MSELSAASIYLLKSTILDDAAAFKADPRELRSHRVEAGETTGTLYLQVGEESPPEWIRALAPVSTPDLDETTHSLGAVLVLSTDGRRFAVTFGSGRHLLDPESYVRDFGLLCSLNGVDPAQLRGAEARTFDDYALHTLRQLSRLSDLKSLELNTDRELVVALSGRLEDTNLGTKVDGRDAVRITAQIDPAELRAKCVALLKLSEQTTYKDRFPFYDRIRRVSDPTRLRELNQRAYSVLGQQKFDEFDLFPPQVISDEIVIFAVKTHRNVYTQFAEPEPTRLRYAIRGPQGTAEVERRIRSKNLLGMNANGDVVGEWSFWECLHWEFTAEGMIYVLDAATWYEIDSNWVADVEAFAAKVGTSGIQWPPAKQKQREEHYNEEAAAALGYALMDQRFIQLEGQTKIEACDLFAAPLRFVHVKKRKGGSGPLSHLFAQALVSAESFVSVPEFRSLLAAELEGAKAGYGQYASSEVDAHKSEVVLALITTPGSKGDVLKKLPFFSKVTLKLIVTRLESMGLTVFVDPIVTQTGVSTRPGKAARKSSKSPTKSAQAPRASGQEAVDG
jgi:uncharacterized protein (TIGR04141 family)